MQTVKSDRLPGGPSRCGVDKLVRNHLRLASISWSIGTVGAIAEFFRADGEALDTDGATYAITERGAIRIVVNPATRAVTYPSGGNGRQAIALCLPESACTMHDRRAITEVGPDPAALRKNDRAATLFDLGLHSPYFDFHIRTSDQSEVRRLREGAGQSLFDPGHGLLQEIAGMNPHRVFVSKLGRIEVYQPITRPGDRTPEGPHTHLLPSLLASGRVVEEGTPIPPGWIPCATCYCAGTGVDVNPAARR